MATPPPTTDVSALILAGGSGVRLGGRPKAFLEVDGISLLDRVVSQFARFSDQVVVGLPAKHVHRGRDLVGDAATVLPGGATRQETFDRLLAAADRRLVIVHDVARPLTSDRLIASVLAMANATGSGVPIVRHVARDSLALADHGLLGPPVDRDRLVAVQTPYAFTREVLLDATAAAKRDAVDVSSITTLVTRMGTAVHTVEGLHSNIKITLPVDWEKVEAELSQTDESFERDR